ncbi:anti-sigma factor antagonist [Abyssicoccus albus]|uniref:anti-sigma factor antagonist n=1 Tax=Abyssicoccus albus TaxID=1817405 RepID=UPI00097E1DF5|nr:anti-sigma factor antagonist [Abyssicoccus albus]AQL55738.1 anti-anti-sigma factor [Abyssicoccus albus]
MNLNIEKSEYDKYYDVKLNGELDVYTAPELRSVLEPLREKGDKDIHIDLEELSYMDSTGLGIFVGTIKELNKNEKNLYVLNASERIFKLFEITGLNGLMYVNEKAEVDIDE